MSETAREREFRIENDHLRADLAEADVRCARLAAQVGELIGERDAARASAEAERERLRADRDAARASLSGRMGGAADDLLDQISALRAQLAEKERLLVAADRAVEALQQDNAVQQVRIVADGETIARLRGEIAEAQDLAVRRGDIQTRLQGVVNELRAQLAAAEARERAAVVAWTPEVVACVRRMLSDETARIREATELYDHDEQYVAEMDECLRRVERAMDGLLAIEATRGERPPRRRFAEDG